MSAIKISDPTPPAGRPHKAIKDQQSTFAKITAKTPVDEAFRAAFIKSKLRMAHTHPGIGLAERDLLVQSLAERLGPQAREFLTQPVPGGVGYGVFYTTTYKTGWGHGTSFACDFVCPSPPGGN